LARYLLEIDAPPVEVLCGVVLDEPFTHARTKNAAAAEASTPYLVFTNAGTYAPRSLMHRTVDELDTRPDCVAFALRLDGTKDYGVFPNPFAQGDWLAIRVETFDRIGRWNTSLREAGGVETELIGRAHKTGCPLVIFEDRVFHSWHDVPPNPDDWQRDARENERIMEDNGVPFLRHWGADMAAFVPQTGSHTIPVRLDGGDERYWACIFQDKQRRVGPFEERT